MARKNPPMRELIPFDIGKSLRSATLSEMKKQYAIGLKRANDRIKNIHKQGAERGSFAYQQYVKNQAGREFIKQNKRGEYVFKMPKAPGKKATANEKKQYREDIRHALERVESFLNAKTGSVRGVREVRAIKRERLLQRMEYLADKHDFTLPEMTDDELDDILNWLGSKDGQKEMEIDDSNQVRDILAVAYVTKNKDKKKPYQSVEDIYNDYLKSKKDWAEYLRKLQQLPSFHV